MLLGPEGSDSSWWLRHARLEVLASTYGVVFLMPAVLEGCGFDMAFGYRFGQSLCQDLFVELEHDLPSLALRPETTWVVGLGFSGLGALHAALTRPTAFAELPAWELCPTSLPIAMAKHPHPILHLHGSSVCGVSVRMGRHPFPTQWTC